MVETVSGISFFEALGVVLFWLSPVVFIFGVALLLTSLTKYNKLENILGKEIGGIKKRIFPELESNIYTLQQKLLQSRIIIALACVVCAAIFFFLLRR